MVLTRALAFMNDPALARSVLPGAGERFDIEAFPRERDTLYPIAGSEYDDSPIAPLFAAMGRSATSRRTPGRPRRAAGSIRRS
jgi:hypothetical protein